MNQPTRMWKTLGCLVAAMSGTAAMLDWMDPAQPRLAQTIPPSEIPRLAHRAVTTDVVIDTDKWVDVKVSPVPVQTLQGRMLTATGARGAWHFLVDHNGYPARGRHWRAQEADEDAPGTVQILVARSDGGVPMTAEQWRCVRALVAVLSDTAGSPEASLPLHLHDSLGYSFGALRGTDLHTPSAGQTTG